MTLLVDGAAARALGTLARDRWRRATGEILPSASRSRIADPWPEHVSSDAHNVPVGISRTMPQWQDDPEIREIETAYLDGIRAAHRVLYFENQYFASPLIGDALAERLAEENGPEIIIITGKHAPSFFDRIAMDPQRDALVRRLRAADPYGRFQAYAPYTSGGRPILVPSKVMIADDRLVRIGSSNLADRSFGFDTECDLIVEITNCSDQVSITQLRDQLVSHFLGIGPGELRRAVAEKAGFVPAIESLDGHPRRLRPIFPSRPKFPRSLIARFHLGDPAGAQQAWRPWRRRWGA